MNRMFKWLLHLGLIAVLGLPTAFADSNTAANQLFVETAKLLLEAKQAPVERQLELYQQALANLDKIVAQYPSSDLAVKLASGQAIGKIDRSKIEVDQREAMKTVCYQQPKFSCVVLLALEATHAIDDTAKIAAAQAKVGEKEGARATLRQVLNNVGAVKAEELRAKVLGWIAAAQALMEERGSAQSTFRQALDIARAIDNADKRNDTLNEIATAQAEAGDFKQALETASAINKEAKRDYTLKAIATAQAEAGDFKQALETLYTMNGVDDITPLADAVRAIAAAQAAAGYHEGAQASLKLVLDKLPAKKNNDVHALSLSRIAVTQVIIGDRQGAQATLGQALNAAHAVNDEYSRARALGGVAAAQVVMGDLAEAQVTLRQAMDNVRLIDNKGLQRLALSRIASAQASMGAFQDALDTASTIEREKNDDYRNQAFMFIALRQAQAGDFKKALDTTRMIDNASPHSTAFALVTIATEMAKARRMP